MSEASHNSPPHDSILQARETLQKALQSGLIIIYILGGPGSGKGITCTTLLRDPTISGFSHLCIGDILRDEVSRPGSRDAALISRLIAEGTLIPTDIVKKHLLLAMEARVKGGCRRLLVDGFPRSMAQAVELDELYYPNLVLSLHCSPETLLRRVVHRGTHSSRVDDNEHTTRRRLEGHSRDTVPVIEHYERMGKVVNVDSEPPFDEMYAEIKAVLMGLGLVEGGREIGR